MSETNPPTTDVPPATAPAEQPPAPQTQRPPVVVNNNTDLLAAINSLPEKLIDAFKESVPAPAPEPVKKDTSPAQPPVQSAKTETVAKRRTFGEVWFGVRK